MVCVALDPGRFSQRPLHLLLLWFYNQSQYPFSRDYYGMTGEPDVDINLAAAIFPPALIIAVVIYLMRDLKGDLRHTESLLIGRMDRLRDDYSREMSELKGMLSRD